MASTSWLAGISGNWTNIGLWTAGVPDFTSLAAIDQLGTYTVTISSGALASVLTLDAANATLNETSAGALTATGLIVDDGTAILKGTNTLASVTVNGGLLQFGASALGSAPVTLDGGELAALAKAALGGHLTFGGSASTLAAAAGKALTVSSGGWTVDDTLFPTITFGDLVDTGTVKFGGSGNTGSGNQYIVAINAGTLQAIDGGLTHLLVEANGVVLAAGATIDWKGNDGQINNLSGNGAVVNSASHEFVLTLQETVPSTFDGTISGAIRLVLGGSNTTYTLTGQNTYTGETIIPFMTGLELGDGTSDATLGPGEILNSGALFVHGNASEHFTQSISGGGILIVDLGHARFSLNSLNSFVGGIQVRNGTTLAVADPVALSVNEIQIESSGFLATADMTVTNDLRLGANFGGRAVHISAAHGTHLSLKPSNPVKIELDNDPVVHFGSPVNDGAVIWRGPGAISVSGSGFYRIAVDGGTLKAGTDFGALLVNADSTAVASGAKIDLNGIDCVIGNLLGAGTVSSGASALLTLAYGDFAGTLSGDLLLKVTRSVVLSGDNTFVGSTLIQGGATLAIGAGGASGVLPGDVDNHGTLIFNRSDATSLTTSVSGSGRVLDVLGTLTIDRNETFTGGMTIAGGSLSIDRSGAIGPGALTFDGGHLLATRSIALANDFILNDSSTIAAVHGRTLAFNGAAQLNPGSHDPVFVFGQGANDGTIVLHASSFGVGPGNYQVEIAAGTLRDGDGSIGFLAGNDIETQIDTGATLDVGGFGDHIVNLQGGGVLQGAGNSVILVSGGNFGGQVNGDVGLDVFDYLFLSGGGTLTGSAFIENGATLELAGPAHEDAAFNDANSTLQLDDTALYTGTVSGFGAFANTVLDLREIDFSAGVTIKFKSSTGILTVSDGTNTSHVALAGTYTAANFSPSIDAHGGTDLTFI